MLANKVMKIQHFVSRSVVLGKSNLVKMPSASVTDTELVFRMIYEQICDAMVRTKNKSAYARLE